jgi:hypothetical protein
LEAEATEPLEMVDEDEGVKEERLELEAVCEMMERVEVGEGVGETVESSSVETTEVRVELERTVDCAGG